MRADEPRRPCRVEHVLVISNRGIKRDASRLERLREAFEHLPCTLVRGALRDVAEMHDGGNRAVGGHGCEDHVARLVVLVLREEQRFYPHGRLRIAEQQNLACRRGGHGDLCRKRGPEEKDKQKVNDESAHEPGFIDREGGKLAPEAHIGNEGRVSGLFPPRSEPAPLPMLFQKNTRDGE